MCAHTCCARDGYAHKGCVKLTPELLLHYGKLGIRGKTGQRDVQKSCIHIRLVHIGRELASDVASAILQMCLVFSRQVLAGFVKNFACKQPVHCKQGRLCCSFWWQSGANKSRQSCCVKTQANLRGTPQHCPQSRL